MNFEKIRNFWKKVKEINIYYKKINNFFWSLIYILVGIPIAIPIIYCIIFLDISFLNMLILLCIFSIIFYPTFYLTFLQIEKYREKYQKLPFEKFLNLISLKGQIYLKNKNIGWKMWRFLYLLIVSILFVILGYYLIEIFNIVATYYTSLSIVILVFFLIIVFLLSFALLDVILFTKKLIKK